MNPSHSPWQLRGDGNAQNGPVQLFDPNQLQQQSQKTENGNNSGWDNSWNWGWGNADQENNDSQQQLEGTGHQQQNTQQQNNQQWGDYKQQDWNYNYNQQNNTTHNDPSQKFVPQQYEQTQPYSSINNSQQLEVEHPNHYDTAGSKHQPQQYGSTGTPQQYGAETPHLQQQHYGAVETPQLQQQYGAVETPLQQQQYGAVETPHFQQQQYDAVQTPQQQQQYGAVETPQQQYGAIETPQQQQQYGGVESPQQQYGAVETPHQQYGAMETPQQQQYGTQQFISAELPHNVPNFNTVQSDVSQPHFDEDSWNNQWGQQNHQSMSQDVDSSYEDGTAATFFGKDDDYDHGYGYDASIANRMEELSLNSEDNVNEIAASTNVVDQQTVYNPSPFDTLGTENQDLQHSTQSSTDVVNASFVIGSETTSAAQSRRESDFGMFDNMQDSISAHPAASFFTQQQSPYENGNRELGTDANLQQHLPSDFINQSNSVNPDVSDANKDQDQRPGSATEFQHAVPPVPLYNPLSISQSLPSSPFPQRVGHRSPASHFKHHQTDGATVRPSSSLSAKSHDSFAHSETAHATHNLTNSSRGSSPHIHSDKPLSPLSNPYRNSPRTVPMQALHESNDSQQYHASMLPTAPVPVSHPYSAKLPEPAPTVGHEKPSGLPPFTREDPPSASPNLGKNIDGFSETSASPVPPSDLSLGASHQNHSMSIYHSPIEPHPNSPFQPIERSGHRTNSQSSLLSHSSHGEMGPQQQQQQQQQPSTPPVQNSVHITDPLLPGQHHGQPHPFQTHNLQEKFEPTVPSAGVQPIRSKENYSQGMPTVSPAAIPGQHLPVNRVSEESQGTPSHRVPLHMPPAAHAEDTFKFNQQPYNNSPQQSLQQSASLTTQSPLQDRPQISHQVAHPLPEVTAVTSPVPPVSINKSNHTSNEPAMVNQQFYAKNVDVQPSHRQPASETLEFLPPYNRLHGDESSSHADVRDTSVSTTTKSAVPNQATFSATSVQDSMNRNTPSTASYIHAPPPKKKTVRSATQKTYPHMRDEIHSSVAERPSFDVNIPRTNHPSHVGPPQNPVESHTTQPLLHDRVQPVSQIENVSRSSEPKLNTPNTPQQHSDLTANLTQEFDTPGGSSTSTPARTNPDLSPENPQSSHKDVNAGLRDDSRKNRFEDENYRGTESQEYRNNRSVENYYGDRRENDRRDSYDDRRDSRSGRRDREYDDYYDRNDNRSRYRGYTGRDRDPYRPRTPSRDNEDPYCRPTTPSREYESRRYSDPRYSEQKDRGRYHDYYERYGERPPSRQYQKEESSERPRSRQGEVEPVRSGSRNSDMERPRSRGADDYYRDYYNRRAEYDKYYSDYGNRYYNDRSYEDYYNYQRQDRYNRGYYEEMQYYGQQYSDERYRDYYYSQSFDGSDRLSRSSSRSQSRSQSRGATPSLPDYNNMAQYDFQKLQLYEQQRSRPSSRQSYEQNDEYYARQSYSRSHSYDNYNSDQGLQQSQQSDGRATPMKYVIPHVRACFGPCGQVIKVLPNRPLDGQPARVEIVELESVIADASDVDTLRTFPGPLVKSETHKNDVLTFCHHKARIFHDNVEILDRSSAELLWKYLQLLIKQNGTVIGTDLAELLLDGHLPSSDEYRRTGIPIVMSHANLQDLQASGQVELSEDNLVVTSDRSFVNSAVPASSRGTLSIDAATDRFRHLLMYGRKKDALESAVKNNLWGHALFLASKMDTRTYANILTRFANNSMKMNDPLQTLYQVMSGRQPAAVTCVSEEGWGDWRPHLAMVLSNPSSSKPDLDKKSITTLGDTLASRSCLHASHFCYLMAQHSFGSFFKKTSKLVLIGSSHVLPFGEFATNDAIQCTEIYEYAVGLGNPHMLYHFQPYKFIYACRLAEAGLSQDALHYCEVIANTVVMNPAVYNPTFVHLLNELSNRLKYSDQQRYQYGEFDDPVWLQRLGQIVNAFADGSLMPISGVVTPGYSSTNTGSEADDLQPYQDLTNPSQGQENYGYYNNQQGYNVVQPQQQQPPQEMQQQQWNYYGTEGQQAYGNAENQAYDPNQQANWQQWQQQPQQQGYDGQYYNPQYQQQQIPDGNQLQQQQQGSDQPDGVQDVNLSGSMNSNYTANTAASDDTEDTISQTGESFDYYGASQQQQLDEKSASLAPTLPSPDIISQASDTETVAQSVSSPIPISSHKASNNSSHSNSLDKQMANEGLRRVRQTSVGSNGSRYSQSPPGSQPSSPTAKSPSTGFQTPPPRSPGRQLGQNNRKNNQQGGWFGGFFERFSKSKNQMNLPDDKNPPIVWDPVKKRWMNSDGEDEDETTVAPPPKDIDLVNKLPQSYSGISPSGVAPPTAGVSPPTMGNRFSRQKIRGARGQYVDVLNSSGPAAPVAPSNLFNVMPSMPPSGNSMMPTIFMPGGAGGDMGAAASELPSPGASYEYQQGHQQHLNDPSAAAAQLMIPLQQSEFTMQHSRSSSMSSVSQEVQRINQTAPETPERHETATDAPPGDSRPPPTGAPFMYNPTQFGAPQTMNTFPAPSAGAMAGTAPSGRLKYGARRAYPK